MSAGFNSGYGGTPGGGGRQIYVANVCFTFTFYVFQLESYFPIAAPFVDLNSFRTTWVGRT